MVLRVQLHPLVTVVLYLLSPEYLHQLFFNDCEQQGYSDHQEYDRDAPFVYELIHYQISNHLVEQKPLKPQLDPTDKADKEREDSFVVAQHEHLTDIYGARNDDVVVNS